MVREAPRARSQKARSGTLRSCYATLKEGAGVVIEPETVAFLESGCAVIVGSVGADGEPRANRGWGITVLPDADDTKLRVRVLVDASDPVVRENLERHGAIAVTAGNVRTLRSTQLKGHARAIEPATAADRDRAARYVAAFVGDVVETDRTPRELIERMVPADFVACVMEVDELYDQTPGPGAGARLERAAS
jgi:hypothetical protein